MTSHEPRPPNITQVHLEPGWIGKKRFPENAYGKLFRCMLDCNARPPCSSTITRSPSWAERRYHTSGNGHTAGSAQGGTGSGVLAKCGSPALSWAVTETVVICGRFHAGWVSIQPRVVKALEIDTQGFERNISERQCI